MDTPAPASFPKSLGPVLSGLVNLRARTRLLLALVLAGSCWQLAPEGRQFGTRLIATWDVFTVSILVLIWLAITQADAAHLRRRATTEDPGRRLTLAALLLAAGASRLAVTLLLGGLRHMSPSERVEHVLLPVVAVLGAWLLLHTVFTLRYAHLYFTEDPDTPEADAVSGLEFPGAAPATYWDFAYFSFVVGMTAQTADVGISSP